MPNHSSTIPRPAHRMYLLGFILGIHIALPAYLYSSFLSQFLPEKYVGVIFALASLATLWVFMKLPSLLRRHGNFKSTLGILTAAIVTTALLAVIKAPIAIVAVFIINAVSVSALIFNLDIFLEHSSPNRVTGEIRGLYLACASGAWVIAQIINSFVLHNNQYTAVFLLAAVAALPLVFLVKRDFRRFQDPHYHDLPPLKLFSRTTRDRNISGIYTLNFLLQFFYSWMVIYTPLYLHNHLGFDWSSIAVIFSIMLVPFVLIQGPLGKIADRWLGEKELLVAGFLVMSLATFLIGFVVIKSLFLWAILLFVSRIGAATTEVMSETFFFKHVSDKDVSIIGLFRTTRPLSYVVAPIVATVLLLLIDIQYLFSILGAIMFYGATRALTLKDTR